LTKFNASDIVLSSEDENKKLKEMIIMKTNDKKIESIEGLQDAIKDLKNQDIYLIENVELEAGDIYQVLKDVDIADQRYMETLKDTVEFYSRPEWDRDKKIYPAIWINPTSEKLVFEY